jgi:predicted Fe-S protein YdhL (DUF1289 family)
LNSVDWERDICDDIVTMRRTEMQHTFDELTLSDLHKDARGYRPRSEYFWANWNESTNDGKQAIWNSLIDEMVESQEAEAAYERVCVEDFEAQVKQTMGYGAPDRETALRWITDGEIFNHTQDIESFVYNRGILFTDYGRELVKELIEVVIFEDPED